MKPSSIHQQSTEILQSTATELLAKCAYKEAIDVYKLLRKRHPDGHWQSPLAQAYTGRAQQLADKHMYREAAALLDNCAALQPLSHTAAGDYIEWLLRAGQTAKALAKFSDLKAHIGPAVRRTQLESILAARLLSDSSNLLKTDILSAEDPLRRHCEQALAALSMYCDHAPFEQVRSALQNIPFRSPYRDLRQWLSALLLLEQDPTNEAALAQLAKLPTDSAFAGLVAALTPNTLRNYPRLDALQRLSGTQQTLAMTLMGLDKPHQVLMSNYAKLGNNYDAKTLLRFIADHKSTLNNEQARRTAAKLLVHYPAGKKLYQRLFGTLPAFDADRASALRAEADDDLRQFERSWIRIAERLRDDITTPDNALAAALIMRHVGDTLLQEWPDSNRPIPPALLRNLEISLQLDTEDPEWFLRVAHYHRLSRNSKAQREWLERALQHHPRQPAVLQAAMAAAKARRAYKKAASYAQTLLSIDPINRQAQTALIDAHLAHAHKSIAGGKAHIAAKELDTAATLERQTSGRVELGRALLAASQGQRSEASHYFSEALTVAQNSLAMALRLQFEAESLAIDTALFKTALAPVIKRHPERSELTELIGLANEYLENDHAIAMNLDTLSMPLRRALDSLTERDDEPLLRAVCECFARVPHFVLLEYAAKQALSVWPDKPIYVYYRILARTEDNIMLLSQNEIEALEDALEQAEEARDIRTVSLIERLLPFSNPFFGPLHEDDEPPVELQQAGELLDQLPPAERRAALIELIDLLEENTGRNMSQDIREQLFDALDNDIFPPADAAPPEPPLPLDIFDDPKPRFSHGPGKRRKHKKKKKRR